MCNVSVEGALPGIKPDGVCLMDLRETRQRMAGLSNLSDPSLVCVYVDVRLDEFFTWPPGGSVAPMAQL